MSYVEVGHRGAMRDRQEVNGVVRNIEVRTGSRVRAWWLTTFRGYRIRTVRRQPREGLFGIVRYQCHWLLEWREEAR